MNNNARVSLNLQSFSIVNEEIKKIKLDPHYYVLDETTNIVDCDFVVFGRNSHDGTLIFILDFFGYLLNNYLYKEVLNFCYLLSESRSVIIKKIKIGFPRITSVYGRVNLPCGERRGQTDQMFIPIKIEYIKG